MNPTAAGNDPKKAGKTGIVYLLIAILFFIRAYWSIGKPEKNDKEKVSIILKTDSIDSRQ